MIEYLLLLYNYFNLHLFQNTLNECLITISNVKNTKGVFCLKRFSDGIQYQNEIILNPYYFKREDNLVLFSTLAHEMCHLYCSLNGEKASGNYHSVRWAEKMKEIGLKPTNDGTMNGKETGFSMTQLIIPGGHFEEKSKEFIAENGEFKWYDRKEEIDVKKENTLNGKKYKYSCSCSNVWGKKGLDICCSRCGQKMICKI